MNATAARTWPTLEELEAVLDALSTASSALDRLVVDMSQLMYPDREEPREGVERPTLTDLGALTRFLEFAGLEVAQSQEWVDDLARFRHGMAYLVTSDAS